MHLLCSLIIIICTSIDILIKINSSVTIKKFFSACNAECDVESYSFKLTQHVGDLMTCKHIFRVTLKNDEKNSELCNAWKLVKKVM